MLQRIQTVYFSLAVILMALPLFGMELFSFHLDKGEVIVSAFTYSFAGTEEVLKKNDIWLLTVVEIIFALIIIFSYKWRGRQLFIGWILFVLNLLTTGWIFLAAFVESNSCPACKIAPQLQFGTVLFISALAFIFIFLGIMGVRKDKKTIDSLNRLR
jgi:hypothetical protein